jgi:hypothetical protein
MNGEPNALSRFYGNKQIAKCSNVELANSYFADTVNLKAHPNAI